MPLELHLGTVDVLADGDASLVVYSTDLLPDEAKGPMDGASAETVAGLRSHLES